MATADKGYMRAEGTFTFLIGCQVPFVCLSAFAFLCLVLTYQSSDKTLAIFFVRKESLRASITSPRGRVCYQYSFLTVSWFFQHMVANPCTGP